MTGTTLAVVPVSLSTQKIEQRGRALFPRFSGGIWCCEGKMLFLLKNLSIHINYEPT